MGTGVASHPGTDCDQSAANQMECWMVGMLFPSALQGQQKVPTSQAESETAERILDAFGLCGKFEYQILSSKTLACRIESFVAHGCTWRLIEILQESNGHI